MVLKKGKEAEQYGTARNDAWCGKRETQLLESGKRLIQLPGGVETWDFTEQEIPETESPPQHRHYPQGEWLPENMQDSQYGKLYLKSSHAPSLINTFSIPKSQSKLMNLLYKSQVS